MWSYIVGRMLAIIPVVLLVSIGTFGFINLLPGDPVVALLGSASQGIDEQTLALRREELGLNRPLPVQYLDWLGGVVTGSLGRSATTRQPITEALGERFPVTLQLALASFVISLAIALPTGIVAAYRRNSFLDRALSVVALSGVAMPSFWLGILLIVVFAAWLRVLPSAGLVSLGYEESLANKAWHPVLPAATLAAAHLASLALYARAAVINVLGEDYVRTARAKGLGERAVAFRHVLRAAAIPIATIAGLSLAHLLEGSIVVETVFAWPGVGHLTVSSVARRDYPVLMVIALLAGTIVVTVNLLTDVAYHWLDPRVGLD